MTAHPRPFASWLAPHFDRFVALKQAGGVGYASQINLLLAFDRHMRAHAPHPPLSREALIRYLASLDRLSPRGRDNVIAAVWPAVAYARQHGALVETLPARPPRPWKHWRKRQPRILSVTEVESIVAAARRLPPVDRLRPATIATLLGLLYTTGIRIGEALALDVGDLDQRGQIVAVRKGKFGKTRALPIRGSTVEALDRYLRHPMRLVGTNASAPIFVSNHRHRLSDCTVRPAIQSACCAAGIPKPWPRPHDFRHTLAVNCVATGYAEGRDVNALLSTLSTYLGHVSIENTRLYLTANGALLEQAAARFALKTSALDEVLS